MQRYDTCSCCNRTIDRDHLDGWEVCEDCSQITCKDCLIQGCLICKTKREEMVSVSLYTARSAEAGMLTYS